MRLQNQPMKGPTDAERAAGYGNSLLEVMQTREDLIRAELALRDANAAWRSFVFNQGMWSYDVSFLTSSRELGTVTRELSSHMSALKYRRRKCREAVRTAYRAYYDAVVPPALRQYRITKLMAKYIKGRLNAPSFTEQIFPAKVVAARMNRHMRRAEAAKNRKKISPLGNTKGPSTNGTT